MPEMPFACRERERGFQNTPPGGSQPRGAEHTLSSPSAWPVTEDEGREDSGKANPCSVGPRGSPQGDRMQARMTQHLRPRTHSEGERSHRQASCYVPSPQEVSVPTATPQSPLHPPLCPPGWGPGKGAGACPTQPQSRPGPTGFMIFPLAHTCSLQTVHGKLPPRCSSSAETPTGPQVKKQTTAAPRCVHAQAGGSLARHAKSSDHAGAL